MRGILLISSSLALAAIATPAWGQASTRTNQIICELTGDCDGPVQVGEDQRLDKGETAGFSFTRPGSKPAAPTSVAPRTGSRQASYVPMTIRQPKSAQATVARPAARRAGPAEMRVTFALGSAEVLPSSRDEIEAFVRALQSSALAGKRFRVEGHTDASGAADRNARLSQERAEAVAAMLKAKGIEAERIEAKGYGFDKPLPGQGKLSSQNRRVELVPIG